MGKTITIIACFIMVIFTISSVYAAKTYNKKTKDNEVYTKNEVQVEQVDDVPTITVVTLNSLYTERAVAITTRDNAITRIAELDAKIALVDIEASKVILKEPEE